MKVHHNQGLYEYPYVHTRVETFIISCGNYEYYLVEGVDYSVLNVRPLVGGSDISEEDKCVHC